MNIVIHLFRELKGVPKSLPDSWARNMGHPVAMHMNRTFLYMLNLLSSCLCCRYFCCYFVYVASAATVAVVDVVAASAAVATAFNIQMLLLFRL